MRRPLAAGAAGALGALGLAVLLLRRYKRQHRETRREIEKATAATDATVRPIEAPDEKADKTAAAVAATTSSPSKLPASWAAQAVQAAKDAMASRGEKTNEDGNNGGTAAAMQLTPPAAATVTAVVQSLGAMVFLSDYLGVDGLLDTLSYTNAVTLARIACTSRMGAVAAHEAQQRPALCVVKGNLETVKAELREQLAAKPTVVFVQYSLGHNEDEDEFEAELANFMDQKLPPSTQVLGGSTMSLQCAWFPKNAASSKGVARQTTLDCRNRFERCEVALLAATFPEAKARAYHVMPKGAAKNNTSESDEEYSYSDMEDEDEENLLPDETQAKGGYGQATKGGPPAAKTSSEDRLNELLNLEPAPKVVVVYDADRGSTTARVISKIQEAYPEAAIVGGVVMGRRVVAKRGQGALSNGRGVGALAISGNAPLFAMTCPFTGCVKTAEKTVATCMKSAAEMAAEKCQSILGALLFTCNARGSHMFGRDAKDAALFKAQFPRAPLMGFYAAGEIGPQVEDGAEHAFLRGNACLQGFTAVFGLFLVPSKHMPSAAFQRAMLHGEVQEAFADTR